MKRWLTIAFALEVATGCASTDGVVRVVDDRAIVGAFVPSEAYAAYLRGAIAEASHDLPGAIEGYSIAVALGPRDPEPWTRLGDARCAHDPRDPKADDAIDHALAIDGGYAPAWEARSRCAMNRGDASAATASANRAVEADASSVAAVAALASADRGSQTRARLVAITLAASTDATGWHALAAWARGHGDAPLEAHALAQVARLEPGSGAAIDAVVTRLLAKGELASARRLARARVESAQHGAIDPLVARLAIDAAILAGELDVARRFAAKAHLPLVVVAARALLLGDTRAARSLSDEIVAADPRAVAARLVLAAAGDALHDSALVIRAFAGIGTRDDAPVPAEAWLAYARLVAREGSTAAARAVLFALSRDPMLHGDPLTTPLAFALTARGVIDAVDASAAKLR